MSFDSEHDFAAESPSWFQRIRGMLSRQERWRDLNWAIAAYPNVAANYVLRGELLLKLGDTLGAIADFERALALAMVDVDRDDWGVVAQSVQDRALVGLRDALNRAARYNAGSDPLTPNPSPTQAERGETSKDKDD